MFAFSICHSLIQLWLTRTSRPEWTVTMQTVGRLMAESHLICDEFQLGARSCNLSARRAQSVLKNMKYQINMFKKKQPKQQQLWITW